MNEPSSSSTTQLTRRLAAEQQLKSSQLSTDPQSSLLAKWKSEFKFLPAFMQQHKLRIELPAEIGLTVFFLLNFKELKLTASFVCKAWAVLAAEVERAKNNATDKAHGWDDAWCQFHLASKYKVDTTIGTVSNMEWELLLIKGETNGGATGTKLQFTRGWTAGDIYYNYPWAQVGRVETWKTIRFEAHEGSIYRCKLKNIEQCIFYLSVSTLYEPQDGMNNLLPQFLTSEWASRKSDDEYCRFFATYKDVDQYRKDDVWINSPQLPIYKVRLKPKIEIKVCESAFRWMGEAGLYAEDIRAKIADVAHIELLEPKQSLTLT